MVERIQKIIQHKKLSASGFADAIGVPRSTISHILSGRNNPSLEFVLKVLDAYPDIRMEWLIQGKGYMLHAASGSLFPDEDDILIMPSPKDTKQPEKPQEMPDKGPIGAFIGGEEGSAQAEPEETQRTVGSDTAASAQGPDTDPTAKEVAAAATARDLNGQEISRVMIFYKNGSFSIHHPSATT